MKLVHRIGLRISGEQRRELEALGVAVPAGIALPGAGDPLVAFEVDEDHPSWPALQARFEEWKASDTVTTEFSKDEVHTARWLALTPEWHHGYPQPDEHEFGYREATYDLTSYCGQCGAGMTQKAPFQMKGEPRWGKKGILQLNWVLDEFFTKPDIWANVFEPHGVSRRLVMNTRGAELQTAVQLVVHEEIDIQTEGLDFEVAACSACGRTKYLPPTRGRIPALVNEPSSAIARTRQYFGSGASAHKKVLVSQALARELVASRVRGVSLWPVDG